MAGLVVATLNTRGTPVRGSRLAERYAAIGETLEASPVDVVTTQEVFTYCHLRRLTRGMPSFGTVSFRAGPVGPAGGLVTLSRRPGGTQRFQRFPLPAAGPPRRARWLAPTHGALVTRLHDPDLLLVNTHPTANPDGDWSDANRFAPLHRQQLRTLAALVRARPDPVVVCGDFNVARDSDLHRQFLADVKLADAFDGECPPTFHAQCLPRGRTARCIDFVLVSSSVVVEEARLMFTEPVPLSGGGTGLVSDHLGLRVTLQVPRRPRHELSR